MKVAWRLDQHSERLGHLASWQTVATPLSATIPTVREKSPDGNGRLSQGGKRRFGFLSDPLAMTGSSIGWIKLRRIDG